MTAALDLARPAAAKVAAPFLRVEGLSKHFAGFTALRDVSIDINPGELVCFLGPSGCGKTTLLRIIAGLETASDGRILRDGREIGGLPPAQRDLGIVFQSYALFPNLTVRGNVSYGLKARALGRARVDERVRELLALVGLSGSEERYPAQLSGGQQQRVALARALAPSPGLLLLDEPLSALDARVRLHLRQEIRKLQRRLGLPTIMVTHDQEEALTISDRIVVMNLGRVEQVGTPAEIYQRPATPFVAGFVGTMNFMPGVATAGDRVRIGSAEITVAPSHRLTVGEPVTLCLRPEDVAVRNITDDTPNSLSAVIGEMELYGSFCRAPLEVPELGAAPLVADFSSNAIRDLSLAPGRPVRIALPADSLQIFHGIVGFGEGAL